MKKNASTGKFFSSRLAVKVGSVLFLAFFIFFSLTAPLVAQFGSLFFLLVGVLFFSDTPAEKPLPPKHVSAIYAPAVPDEFAAAQASREQQIQLPAVILTEEPVEPPRTVELLRYLTHSPPLILPFDPALDTLVRAGPALG